MKKPIYDKGGILTSLRKEWRTQREMQKEVNDGGWGWAGVKLRCRGP